MAFPQVAATNTSAQTGTTSLSVSLPSGIQAGDLLLIFVSAYANAGRSATAPSGWSTLYNAAGTGDLRVYACFWRVATGTEGSSVNVAFNSIVHTCAVSFRITGWAGTAPQASTPVVTTGTSANPGSLAPSWGAKDTLWLAVAHTRPQGDPPSIPANYSSLVTQNAGTSASASVRVNVAQRALNTASEDPGAFSLSANLNYAAVTIGIEPASGLRQIFLGETQIDAIKLGSIDIKAVYLGSTKIFEA